MCVFMCFPCCFIKTFIIPICIEYGSTVILILIIFRWVGVILLCFIDGAGIYLDYRCL